MLKKFIVAGLLVVAAGAAIAQNDPIAQRKAILKGMGDGTKPVVGMLKGEAPFELAKVQELLKAYSDGSKKLPALFPDTSKTGGETKALPKIWDEKTKFEAIFAKLDKDASDTLALIKDEASFKANFSKVLGNCKACHDDYLAKKE
jgi:cytochrome c556